MDIVKTPSPILTQKAKQVEKIDSKIKQLVEEMKVVLRESKIGVGLAAPQVGVPIQLFIAAPELIKPNQTSQNPYRVFINPAILKIAKARKKTGKRKKQLEGCLSIPDIWGSVNRATSITFSYLDEHGKKHTEKFAGFMATIIQHEIDHLQGVLFTHHVVSQGGKLYKQVKDEETGKLVMEEVEI